MGGESKVIDRGAGRGVTAATDRREADKGTAVDRGLGRGRGEGGGKLGGRGGGVIWGRQRRGTSH